MKYYDTKYEKKILIKKNQDFLKKNIIFSIIKEKAGFLKKKIFENLLNYLYMYILYIFFIILIIFFIIYFIYFL